MDVTSIVIIAFLLIFAIIGFCKGFVDVIINSLKSAFIMLISFFLAKPVGNLIYKIGLGNGFVSKLQTLLNTKSEVFLMEVNSSNAAEGLNQGMDALNIPEFFQEIIRNVFGNFVPEGAQDKLGYFCSQALANILCTIIAFFILLLLVTILILVLQKALKNINRVPVIGFINRLLGSITMLAISGLVMCLILWVCASIASFSPEVNDLMIKVFNLNATEFSLAKWLYENNVAILIFKWITTKL